MAVALHHTIQRLDACQFGTLGAEISLHCTLSTWYSSSTSSTHLGYAPDFEAVLRPMAAS
jgi:hypothetical protein